MHIAELYKTRAQIDDLVSELPSGIEFDRATDSLRVSAAFGAASRWGPFRFELVSSPDEAHLSVLTTSSNGDDVTLFVRLMLRGERWPMLLKFKEAVVEATAAADEANAGTCNLAAVVNVKAQTLQLKALRCLQPGEHLTAVLNCEEALPRPLEQHSSSSNEAERSLDEQPGQNRGPDRRKPPRKRPASADGGTTKHPRVDGAATAPSRPPEIFHSLRHCQLCGLFFTSQWMMDVHRQFHDMFAEPLSAARSTTQLVLSAPVFSDAGLAYVPVGLPRLSAGDAARAAAAAAAAATAASPPVDGSAATIAASTADSESHVANIAAEAVVPSTGPSDDDQPEDPLDLTLQRPPAVAPTASLRSSSGRTPSLLAGRARSSSARCQAPFVQQQQQQPLTPPQQQQRKSTLASTNSVMSVCKDCKIGFFNYSNYVVHRSLYCQSSRVAAAAAAAAAAATAAAKLQQQQQQQQQAVKEAAQTPAAATATQEPPTNQSPPPPQPQPPGPVERKFQCPFCQIRFHSPSTLAAHQTFYCPENPDKAPSAAAVAATATTAAAAAALSSTAEETPGEQKPQLLPQQQPPSGPAWLPVLPDGSGGYRCTACGYIGQTERGMKMHAKVHSGGGGGGAQHQHPSTTADHQQLTIVGRDSGTEISNNNNNNIRLPAAFPSDLLSSMTPEELGMLQHKTQPYSKRRTFKRQGHHHHQQHHYQFNHRNSIARTAVLICDRCGDAFDQFEALAEHRETACCGADGGGSFQVEGDVDGNDDDDDGDSQSSRTPTTTVKVKLESTVRSTTDAIGR